MSSSEDATADMVAEPKSRDQLTALPKPPKRMRSVTLGVLAVTGALAVLMAWSLRAEGRYALSEDAVLDLGELSGVKLDDQVANRYVRGRVSLERSKQVSYRRLAERDLYQVTPVANREGLWVEYRVLRQMSGPRFIPPTSVAGRLVPVAELGGRYRGIGAALAEATGRGIGSDWILVDGHDPKSTTWVLGLITLLLVFAGWSALAAFRILRRVRTD